MGYVVDLLGLAYFHERSGLVLMPNGREPELQIAPHYASFFLEKAKVKNAVWWNANQKKVLEERGIVEMPIPKPSRVTISATEPPSSEARRRPLSRRRETVHKAVLPKLRVLDPRLEIEPETADTIVQFPVPEGVLAAATVGRCIVTKLTVPGDTGLVVITAQAAYGETKTITLEEGTEIVFSNTSDLLAAHEEEPVTHFKLYGRLDVYRRSDGLCEPLVTSNVEPLKSSHPYLALIDSGELNVPEPGCSNTCC